MGSLNQLKARSSTIGRELAKIKARRSEPRTQSFRVARIGPGWVLGSIEALSGHASVGSNIAGEFDKRDIAYLKVFRGMYLT